MPNDVTKYTNISDAICYRFLGRVYLILEVEFKMNDDEQTTQMNGLMNPLHLVPSF